MSSRKDWFTQLFGFCESPSPSRYKAIQAKFKLDQTSYPETDVLHSLENGRSYLVGKFGTESLKDLRILGRQLAPQVPGRLEVRHETTGDIFLHHARPENADATFQVASQFNCLEFVSPSVTPEHGVTPYAFDRTQGPACSLAAGAATLVRNYLVRAKGASSDGGQTAENQINNLAGVEELLENRKHNYFQVVNGYVNSNVEALKHLRHRLDDKELAAKCVDSVEVGWHRNVGVNFKDRFTVVEEKEQQQVSQVFCSALSIAYSAAPADAWKPLAQIVLDAMYEATLWAAVINAAESKGRGHRRLLLTMIGGGVFGNEDAWIATAMARAIRAVGSVGLEVIVCHYGSVDENFKAHLDSALGQGAM